MKFTTEKDFIAEALNGPVRAATSKGTSYSVPSLKLKLKSHNLEITGSDPDLVISTRIDVHGEQDGETIVPAKLFQDIIRALDQGAVHVISNDEEITITSGKAEFKVREPVGGELTLLTKATAAGSLLPTKVVAEALNQVVRAALTDNSRAPQLSAVLFSATEDGIRMVATDSYRLAYKDIKGVKIDEQTEDVLIPAKTLDELQRIISAKQNAEDINFSYSDTDAVFNVGDTKLATRLIKGPFPEYQRLLPNNYENYAVVEKEPFINVISRIRLLIRDSKDSSSPVKLNFSESHIEVSVNTPENGSAVEIIEAEYSGDETLIAFNPNYLLDGLRAINSEKVVINIIDSSKPATLEPEEEKDYHYLLMPVRIS